MDRTRCWWVNLFAVASLALPGSEATAQDCSPAGTTVRIQASVTGTDTLMVRYTVTNQSTEALRWVSIGAGGEERTAAVTPQTPSIVETPSGWRGLVVYPEETAYIHLFWEVTAKAAELAPGRSTSFAIRAPDAKFVPRGQVGPYGPIQPINFTGLPFTAGGSGGCWWGHVARSR